jgi:folylpolyglutamate synthase/dihydropteroate synthase
MTVYAKNMFFFHMFFFHQVGLGGRLDSTNVVTPTLAVLTSVQLDHCKVLGNTIEEIAVEKAGIMKKVYCPRRYRQPARLTIRIVIRE